MPAAQTETGKLKPCPFCAGEGKILRRSGVTGRVCRSRYYRERVKCQKCGLTSAEFNAPGKAVAAWNRRADASILSLIEEMAGALEALAKVADEFSSDETERKDDDPVWGYNRATVTYGNFRAARSSLSSYTAFKEGRNG